MRGPYGTRWADIDEPPEVVAEEDAKFITALGIWSAQNALRPPEPDEMPGQPWEPAAGSLRAEVLDLYRSVERLRATRRGRFVWWLAGVLRRLRGLRGSSR